MNKKTILLWLAVSVATPSFAANRCIILYDYLHKSVSPAGVVPENMKQPISAVMLDFNDGTSSNKFLVQYTLTSKKAGQKISYWVFDKDANTMLINKTTVPDDSNELKFSLPFNSFSLGTAPSEKYAGFSTSRNYRLIISGTEDSFSNKMTMTQDLSIYIESLQFHLQAYSKNYDDQPNVSYPNTQDLALVSGDPYWFSLIGRIGMKTTGNIGTNNLMPRITLNQDAYGAGCFFTNDYSYKEILLSGGVRYYKHPADQFWGFIHPSFTMSFIGTLEARSPSKNTKRGTSTIEAKCSFNGQSVENQGNCTQPQSARLD
jgi:hypothetical protein